MARQRKLSPERKAFVQGLIEHYKPETAQDVQDMLKTFWEIPFKDFLKPKWMMNSATLNMIMLTKKPTIAGMGIVRIK